MMVNKAKKGQHREYIARKELEADGWFIAFKSIRNRFGCIDFANLFDIVAYKTKHVAFFNRKYISCKHFGQGNYHQEHQAEIRKFKNENCKQGETYELWLWCERKWVGKGKDKKHIKAHWKKVII